MKKTNKGFSLVELIIVIAIMAILAGAIAPALIRYIDKSRKSNDVTSCKTIKTAIETALGNEDIYAYLTNPATTGGFVVVDITPGKKTSEGESTSTDTGAVAFDQLGTTPADCPSDIDTTAKEEIGTNIGEKTPKLKYKKPGKATGAPKPDHFTALISAKGTVYVTISGPDSPTTVTISEDGKEITATGAYVICPEICEDYQ